MAPNIPALYELHFGVPMAAAVLCTLNKRHDSKMVSMLTVLLKHSEAKVLFFDYQFLDVAMGAIAILSKTSTNLPQQVLVLESDKSSPTASKMVSTNGNLEYERLVGL